MDIHSISVFYKESEEDGLIRFTHRGCDAGCAVLIPTGNWIDLGSPSSFVVILKPYQPEDYPAAVAGVLSGPDIAGF